MLLWLIVTSGFLICVVIWHFWQGITWEEASMLFLSSALIFIVHLQIIHMKATTDRYLVTGYVTSLIHRPAFSYQCGKNTCEEPERWIIEQRPRFPLRNIDEERRNTEDSTERCVGECAVTYPAPFRETPCCQDIYAYTILVNKEKFERTKIGDSSTVWRSYFNPVRISDEVVYNSGTPLPYFKIDDYNRAHRLFPNQVSAENELEKINAEFSIQNLSVAVILTKDNLLYETLKYAWHGGKANDFIVVINTDEKTIRNVNVLAWNNYTLKENVAEAIMALPQPDINQILPAIQTALKQGPAFIPKDFSDYNYLNVKIPTSYYWKIIIFQIIFYIYMMILLRLNPNSKEQKVPLSQILKMWKKYFNPPSASWYFHPLTPTGLVLYILIPASAAILPWA